MSGQDEKQLVREATRIFLRLRNAPEDPDILTERDRFLARGEEERRTYQEIVRAWQATGQKPPSKTPVVLIALMLLSGSLFFAQKPLRVALLADFSTDRASQQVSLSSGDRVDLDAATAIIDETDGDLRHVTLMQGAAFFDVEPSETPFVVEIDEVLVRVLGTSFETAYLDDSVLISVNEGVVEVVLDTQTWTLEAGEQLRLSGEAQNLEDVDPVEVALWRRDRLVADGLTFADVADIIHRRLPGDVFIYDQTLAEARISGGVDLSDPKSALRALAAAEGARLVSTPIATLIFPRR